jgi:DNA-binding transcriptional regulator YdaS (Cro superfamily)
MTPTTHQMIEDLRLGPFRGYGGAKALAAAIGVSILTLKFWRTGKREPSYTNRLQIEALWREKVQTSG